MTESVRGTHVFVLIWNKGWLSDPGWLPSRVSKADTGHMGDPGNLGITMVVTSRLFCMVLDHFMRIEAVFCETNTSPLAKCLVWSNCAMA